MAVGFVMKGIASYDFNGFCDLVVIFSKITYLS